MINKPIAKIIDRIQTNVTFMLHFLREVNKSFYQMLKRTNKRAILSQCENQNSSLLFINGL